MTLCEPCKELGLETAASYQGISAGKSHNGKAVPPKCYHHHFGFPLPTSVQSKIPTDRRHLLNPNQSLIAELPEEKTEIPMPEKISDLEQPLREKHVDVESIASRCQCRPSCPSKAAQGKRFAWGHRPRGSNKGNGKTAAEQAKIVVDAMPMPFIPEVQTMTKIEPAKDSLEIVLLFMRKLEQFTPEERKELLTVIKMLNHPFIEYKIQTPKMETKL